MVNERRRTELDGAALIMATIYAANGVSIEATELHPFRESEQSGMRLTRGNLALVGRAIVDGINQGKQ